MGFFETVLAGLVVAGIAGAVGRWSGRRAERKLYAQQHEAAVKQFATELKRLITNANPDGPEAMTDAQAIVSTRNSLRKVLTSAADSLNSDIDKLQELVGEGQIPKTEQSAVRERLRVLKKSWPAKETELNVVVRKILAEFGLEPKG
jgi:hypothetical protein